MNESATESEEVIKAERSEIEPLGRVVLEFQVEERDGDEDEEFEGEVEDLEGGDDLAKDQEGEKKNRGGWREVIWGETFYMVR